MTTTDFITELFCRVDDAMKDVSKHPQAKLHPSELVTLGLLHALKGSGERAFYRWLLRDYKALFPHLPERTRLFRALATHQSWTRRFLAEPTLLGICDSYGIELLHPKREGRSHQQIGKKGKSNWRWIIGAKLAVVVNQQGLVVDWECATANVHDTAFQPLIKQFEEQMVVLADAGFHAKEGDPQNLKICKRGQWNERMLIETLFSMLHTVCHFKQVSHRAWRYLKARFAFTLALFNILVQWKGTVQFSIAPFSL
jgi:hypothetical protein